MSIVFIPGVGVERNGALRWATLAGIQFQPSEAMKICYIIFISYFITKNLPEMGKLWNGIIKVLVWFVPIIGILFLQEHLSAMIIIGLVGAILIVARWC